MQPVARHILGQCGGPPVSIASTVRCTTADSGALYGSELHGAVTVSIAHMLDQNQACIAKQILGLRISTNHIGAGLELGWTNLSTKARCSRLLLWWRLQQYDSPLLRSIEAYARVRNVQMSRQRKCDYNWWFHTDALLNEVACHYQSSTDDFRRLSRERFRQLVLRWQWRREFDEKFLMCTASKRLSLLTTELEFLKCEEGFERRTSWPGAPYLSVVDSNDHARLLAMARIGTLPIEVETGRWRSPVIPYTQRLCSFGCNVIGDTDHFLCSCAGLDDFESITVMRSTTNQDWKAIARCLELRWRMRKIRLRGGSYPALHLEETLDTDQITEQQQMDAHRA